jgi:3-keto-5-aminohexanoate cleavage enzyme
VRDDDGNPTQDVEVFRRAIDLVRDRCDMVIEVTTGGAVGMSFEERAQPLQLDPEMASLDCGTTNFGDDYIVNTLPMMRRYAAEMRDRGIRPTLECFDLSHIDSAALLIEEGLVVPPLHFGLVLNVPAGVRYDEATLAFLVHRLPDGCYWTAMGIGRTEFPVVEAAVGLGGFVRVGLEDNVYIEKGVLAGGNAQLVEQAVEVIRSSGKEPATPHDVREILELKR